MAGDAYSITPKSIYLHWSASEMAWMADDGWLGWQMLVGPPPPKALAPIGRRKIFASYGRRYLLGANKVYSWSALIGRQPP